MEKMEDIINLIDSREKEKTKNILYKYLKQWHWFLVFCLAGMAFGYFIYKNTPGTYQITSRLLVKSEGEDLSSVLAFKNANNDRRNSSNMENKLGILRSFTLYQNALDSLAWDFSWFQKKLLYNAELYNYEPFELIIPPNSNNAKNIPIELSRISEIEYNIKIKGDTWKNGFVQTIDIEKNMKFGEPFTNEFFNFIINKGKVTNEETYLLVFNNIDALTRNYLSKTNVYAEEENSDIIIIEIEGENRQKEADFINELTKVLIGFGVETNYKSAETSIEFIDEQLERLKTNLSESEDKFSTYRKNNQTVNLGQEAQSVSQRLEEIEQEQYITQLQIDFYNNLQRYLDDAKKIKEIVSPSVVGITDENLNGMLTSLRDLYNRREVLSFSVQDKNPALILIEEQIKVARNGLDQTLKNQLQATELKMRSLDERYSSIQKRLIRLPETEKKLIEVQRDVDLNNEYYNYMLQKKAEASLTKASISPEIRIIDSAIVEAAKQTGPNLAKNVLLGFFGGAIVPFIFISLIGFFNNKIETINEVEKESKIPVFEGIMRHKYKVKLPVIHHPRSGLAESFRGLKTNINTLVERADSRVISVNSLIPGEGKSFISSNLAVIFSKTNKKVLLIGADLHKPTLHEFLGVKETFGLTNYLNNEKSIQDIIFATEITNLYLIQTGFVSENPSDLMDSIKFEKLMEQTRKMFDYVVIDNAPLLLIPDAILMSQLSDITLFILRMNYSHKNEIKQINKITNFNKIDTAAIVLNDTPESGYGYGYGYRKKYWKKGYGEIKS